VSQVSQRRMHQQGGFTLIELMIATAIGLVVLTALTSVLFTTYQANQIATSRVEASGQIRNFEETAYDDFALSSLPPTPGGCGSSSQPPCTQDSIQLKGCAMTNSATPSLQGRTIAYAWNKGTQSIDRHVNAVPVNSVASSVTAFSWYIDGVAPSQSVVVTMTVTISTYSQTQTLRFHPRVVTQLPQYVTSPC
jgi:prepilin-type N-terminal cleavage/methylation domain-containing protein